MRYGNRDVAITLFIVKKIIFSNVFPLCFWVGIEAQNF